MIHYQLRCSHDHEFDGWFSDSAGFDRQAKAGLVECPACGDTQVVRALMAPAVATRNALSRHAGDSAAIPEPGGVMEGPQSALHQSALHQSALHQSALPESARSESSRPESRPEWGRSTAGRSETGPPLASDSPGMPAAARPTSLAPHHEGAAIRAGGRLPDQLRAALQRLRTEVEKRCDYVGPDFATEARRIHRGESTPRGIYGETTPDQAEALAEDGIGFSRIPWVPRADG